MISIYYAFCRFAYRIVNNLVQMICISFPMIHQVHKNKSYEVSDADEKILTLLIVYVRVCI